MKTLLTNNKMASLNVSNGINLFLQIKLQYIHSQHLHASDVLTNSGR